MTNQYIMKKMAIRKYITQAIAKEGILSTKTGIYLKI